MRFPHILAGALLALPTWGMPFAAGAAAAVLQPVIVGLVDPQPDPAALASRLSAAAGVPVRNVNALSPTLVSLTLQCGSRRQCDAAQARLRAASSWVKSVDADAKRTRPTPASAAAARSL
jgi:hypothetical protein